MLAPFEGASALDDLFTMPMCINNDHNDYQHTSILMTSERTAMNKCNDTAVVKAVTW